MKRRTYLATASSTVSALAIAGCMGGGEDDHDDDRPGEEDPDGEEDEPEESGEPASAGTFDDFEDLDDWEAVHGSLSADEERYYEGSQSALLEASESEKMVRIVRELSDPLDCSDVLPGLAAASEGPANVVVQLYNDDGEKVEFRQAFAGDTSLVRRNLGVNYADGDPDVSAVTEIHVVRWTGDESAGRVWVDDLHFTPRPDTGKVLLQFDGGYETDYTEALSVLEEHDLPATSFVATDRIRGDESEEGDGLTVDQVAELDAAGWTIASHSSRGTSLTRLDDDEAEAAVADAVAWLEEQGYEDGARYLSYPAGHYDDRTLDLVDEYHELGFTGRYGIEGSISNPLLCSRVSDLDADEARWLVDKTVEMRGITSLVFYQLDESSRSVLEATAERLASLEADGDVEVVTPADVEDEYVY